MIKITLPIDVIHHPTRSEGLSCSYSKELVSIVETNAIGSNEISSTFFGAH